VPWSVRALRAAADVIVVHDDVARARLLARGVPPQHVHVIAPGSPGASAPPLDRAAARARLGLATDAAVVLFLGFVKPYKGLGVLLDAVARLRDRLPGLVLLIAGAPTAGRGAYDRAIARLGLGPQVRWSGSFVPSEALETHLAAADVVALPYVEASSSAVLLTAYAHGRPVVATAVGGLPALVEHGRTGLLVPPRDPDALARALHTLLDDPARAGRMGEAARARWQQCHRWPLAAAAHAALYRMLWTARA
jgi:D-inositol-3-phosphate glycosyltransferase